jgi:alanine racemase
MVAMMSEKRPTPHDSLSNDAVRLTVDLDALRANYRAIAGLAAPARAGAVVKADAYGLGAATVSRAFYDEGCRDLFVAHLGEAMALRTGLAADATLYILNGLQPGEEGDAAGAGLTPVINGLEQARRWADTARRLKRPLPAVLQVDSGMSRLGLGAEDVRALASDPAFFDAVHVRLVMSHLACGEDPANPANAEQRRRFLDLAGAVPPAPLSLANSAGVFLGPDYRFDLVRPGLALYGAPPPHTGGLAIRPVVSLDARVVQVRDAPAGRGVGYGLTFTTARASRIATVSIGYADGWPRRLGNVGFAYFGDAALPIVGRVSMDSLTLDATDLPDGALALGRYVELLGPHQTLETVARAIDAIPYEILTALGRRHPPLYREGRP